MMAPGPLDALPALLDIVANDERAAELSAAPSKEPMTLKIIRARVRIDFYPSAPAMAVDVRNLLLSARDHYAGRDTVWLSSFRKRDRSPFSMASCSCSRASRSASLSDMDAPC